MGFSFETEAVIVTLDDFEGKIKSLNTRLKDPELLEASSCLIWMIDAIRELNSEVARLRGILGIDESEAFERRINENEGESK